MRQRRGRAVRAQHQQLGLRVRGEQLQRREEGLGVHQHHDDATPVRRVLRQRGGEGAQPARLGSGQGRRRDDVARRVAAGLGHGGGEVLRRELVRHRRGAAPVHQPEPLPLIRPEDEDGLVLAHRFQQRVHLPPVLLRGARLGEQLAREAEVLFRVLQGGGDASHGLLELGLALARHLVHQRLPVALHEVEDARDDAGEHPTQQQHWQDRQAHELGRR